MNKCKNGRTLFGAKYGRTKGLSGKELSVSFSGLVPWDLGARPPMFSKNEKLFLFKKLLYRFLQWSRVSTPPIASE